MIAYKQPITPRRGRIDPRRERRLRRAHAARPRPDHRGVHRHRDRRDPLRHHRRCCSISSASTRSTSCPRSRRCSPTASDGFEEQSLRDDATSSRTTRPQRPTASACRRCSRPPASPPAASPSSSSSTAGCAVNGEVVTELGSRVDPEADLVDVDGTAVQLDPTKRYVMLNKPDRRRQLDDGRARPARPARSSRRTGRSGCTTSADWMPRPAACSCSPTTASSRTCSRIPSFGVTKIYIAKVEGAVTPQTIQKLDARDRTGGRADRRRQGAAARRAVRGRGTLVELTLHSGRNRIVRRMLAAVGHPVSSSCAASSGRSTSGTLRVGRTRDLTKVERGELLTLARRAAPIPSPRRLRARSGQETE